ncbi:putative l,D-transpeptidase [Candidatus Erwinia dacicola]|uniref:L,D-transpeptidase n=1 Tax=Candidatus Erwinia dacicola TaxID=252393 RepID=A0A328TJ37_9GAMM|nr:putative l,D-transpeptidase [Candidatus Erwinia dacicola]
MGKIALLFAMIFLPAVVFASVPDAVIPLVPVSKELKKQLLGTPVYLQIFKEERTLELYGKTAALGQNACRVISKPGRFLQRGTFPAEAR